MKALLVVAHGSRRKESNDEVFVIAEQIKNGGSQQYDIVHAAFLVMADVLIPDGIGQCVAEGASSVVVLPYFLNSGTHVVKDIPDIVDACRLQYPGVDITLANHIGASPLMRELVISSADEAKAI